MRVGDREREEEVERKDQELLVMRFGLGLVVPVLLLSELLELVRGEEDELGSLSAPKVDQRRVLGLELVHELAAAILLAEPTLDLGRELGLDAVGTLAVTERLSVPLLATLLALEERQTVLLVLVSLVHVVRAHLLSILAEVLALNLLRISVVVGVLGSLADGHRADLARIAVLFALSHVLLDDEIIVVRVDAVVSELAASSVEVVRLAGLVSLEVKELLSLLLMSHLGDVILVLGDAGSAVLVLGLAEAVELVGRLALGGVSAAKTVVAESGSGENLALHIGLEVLAVVLASAGLDDFAIVTEGTLRVLAPASSLMGELARLLLQSSEVLVLALLGLCVLEHLVVARAHGAGWSVLGHANLACGGACASLGVLANVDRVVGATVEAATTGAAIGVEGLLLAEQGLGEGHLEGRREELRWVEES